MAVTSTRMRRIKQIYLTVGVVYLIVEAVKHTIVRVVVRVVVLMLCKLTALNKTFL